MDVTYTLDPGAVKRFGPRSRSRASSGSIQRLCRRARPDGGARLFLLCAQGEETLRVLIESGLFSLGGSANGRPRPSLRCTMTIDARKIASHPSEWVSPTTPPGPAARSRWENRIFRERRIYKSVAGLKLGSKISRLQGQFANPIA